MRQKSLFLLIPLLLLIAFAPGCEENQTGEGTDPTASKQKSEAAYKMMEDDMYMMMNGNFRNASDYDQLRFKQMNATFREAIELDPKNYEAKYGAALSEILAVYSDPEVNQLVKDFESAGNSNKNAISGEMKRSLIPLKTSDLQLPEEKIASLLFNINKVALTDPPLISRVQAAIRNKLLPAIDYAIARLVECEAEPNFTFRVTGRMQGDNTLDMVTIYVTEVYFTNALLNAFKSGLEATLIYKFDLTDYSQASLVAALQPNNTSFFYMNTDGQTRAQNVKNAFLGAMNNIKSGIASLESFSGRRPDAVIKIGNSGDRTIKQQDLDTLKKYIDKAIDAFNSTQTVEIKDADSDGNDYTIKINISNFFNNMPQNPKTAFMPSYTVEPSGEDDIRFDFVAQTYSEFTFPDPTFGGLLPDMSNETLKRILYIDEEFAYRFSFSIHKFAAYDDWWAANGMNLTFRFTTQSNNVYTKTVTYEVYEDNSILFKDATSTPDRVTRIELNYGEGYMDYSFQEAGRFIEIRAKEEDYCNFQIFVRPALTNYQVSPNRDNITIYWNIEGNQSGSNYYYLERSVASGAYQEVNYLGGWMNYNYTDFNVTPGVTYSYRLRCVSQWSWGDVLIPSSPVYSNVLTVTP
ncbi:MAG: hypothetical protein HUU54_02705 [Ignavibacteriaceae bacterium]|nr:hypothetical protein [Ignavibacteriaceae bacterium]